MLTFPEPALLLHYATHKVVTAQTVRMDRALAKQIDSQWWKATGLGSDRLQEEDRSWSWVQILGQGRATKGGSSYANYLAVQTNDSFVQGAISYWLNGRSRIVPTAGAVVVECLATAPQNRPWLVNDPQFGGVGSNLLFLAVRHSYSVGLGGRVFLESLPSERTRQFYEDFGFIRLAVHDDGIIEFELTPENAQLQLRENGFL